MFRLVFSGMNQFISPMSLSLMHNNVCQVLSTTLIYWTQIGPEGCHQIMCLSLFQSALLAFVSGIVIALWLVIGKLTHSVDTQTLPVFSYNCSHQVTFNTSSVTEIPDDVYTENTTLKYRFLTIDYYKILFQNR